MFNLQKIREMELKLIFLIAAMHLYGFVAGRASVAEIKNQKDHDKSKKIFINHII